jgi:hypothetical protein
MKMANSLTTATSPVAQIAAPKVVSDSTVAAATPFAALPAHCPPLQPADFYAPQARWSRQLGPMPTHQVNFLTEYLSTKQKFTPFQREQFWECVTEARIFHGGELAVMDRVTETIAKAWNSKHTVSAQHKG